MNNPINMIKMMMGKMSPKDMAMKMIENNSNPVFANLIDMANRGETAKSLEYMMQSAYDFICMLEDEANTDEEMEIIRKYARKISEL